jgi:hypothetical protein
MIDSGIERFLQPTWVRVVCLTLLGVRAHPVHLRPAVASYPLSDGATASMLNALVEAGKVSISRYHELPLWNPFECAGVRSGTSRRRSSPPRSCSSCSPSPATVTMRLWNIVHHAIGFIWHVAPFAPRAAALARRVARRLDDLRASHWGTRDSTRGTRGARWLSLRAARAASLA